MSKEKSVAIKEEIKALSPAQIDAAVSRIAKAMSGIEKGYIACAADVARLYDTKSYKAAGYKNIYEMCTDKFGMSRGTVSNLNTIVARFFDNYKLREDFKGFQIRSLLAMRELTDDEIHLLNITADLSAAEIERIIDEYKNPAAQIAESGEVQYSEGDGENDSESEPAAEVEGIKETTLTWTSGESAENFVKALEQARFMDYNRIIVNIK